MAARNVWRDLLPLNSAVRSRCPRDVAIRASKDSLSLLQRMALLDVLETHRGCINSLQWNETGQLLLSGSDDRCLVITEPYTKCVKADIATPHTSNIFSAKFLPGNSDRKIMSCAGDGTILYTDLEKIEETRSCTFSCHSGATYELLTVPGDPNSFLSCGEDGTVRWFDLRVKECCRKTDCEEDVMLRLSRGVTAMALNPMLPYYLAVGASDSSVRIFDRRMLGSESRHYLMSLVSKFTPDGLEDKRRRITSVKYRPDGQEIVVSISSDHIYVFDPNESDTSKSTRLCVGYPGPLKAAPKDRDLPRPVKKLRLRGDWSDTGPTSSTGVSYRTAFRHRVNPEVAEAAGEVTSEVNTQRTEESHDSFGLAGNVLHHMTNALSRMLNDPSTLEAMRTVRDSLVDSEVRRSQRQLRHQPHSNDHSRLERISAESRESTSSNGVGDASSQNAISPTDGTGNFHEMYNDQRSKENENGNRRLPPTQEQCASSSSYLTDVGMTTQPSVSAATSECPEEDVSSSEGFPPTRSPNEESQFSLMRSTSPVVIRNLPGPSQVLTHHGEPSFNPETGQRQRRRGVSGPPTEPFRVPPRDSKSFLGCDLTEFEEDEDSNEVLGGECEEGGNNGRFKKRYIIQPGVKKKFVGHRNARTMMKEVTWWGNKYILSGSDCGHIFGWDRESQKLVLFRVADIHVVNCLQPHPLEPLIATSGIDYSVKLWSPLEVEPRFDEEKGKQLMEANEIMLQETRDTVTLPAALMIRMLGCLTQVRRAGRLIARTPESEENSFMQQEANRSDASGGDGNTRATNNIAEEEAERRINSDNDDDDDG